MSQVWAERQRSTNRLVRASYQYLESNRRISADTLYALCQLTWITDSYEGANAGYVSKVKVPALETIFGEDYQGKGINEVAQVAAPLLSGNLVKNKGLLAQHTGFTNFYSAYRNSSRGWIKDNLGEIKTIVRDAYALQTDADARKVARKIDKLPKIPSPGGQRSMNPQYLMTPLVFSLDPRLRFPIINGREYVTKLLKQLGVAGTATDKQYDALTGLIGKGGIKDAADLDQVRDSIEKFVGGNKGKHKLSKSKGKGRSLELKDEEDYVVLKKNLSASAKRIHNELTNRLLEVLNKYTILEGSDQNCKYDALIKDYREGSDLLIEVKSSTEIPDVRMAIGQLLDYHRRLTDKRKVERAILLPKEPSEDVKSLIRYAGIGLLYFSKAGLQEVW